MMTGRVWLLSGLMVVMALACGDGGLFTDSGGGSDNAGSNNSSSDASSGNSGGSGAGSSSSNGAGGAGGDETTASSAEASSSQMSSAEMSSSSTGMMSICDPDPADMACMMCIRSQCCPELMACDSDMNCDCWLSCLLDGGSQFMCFQMCGQTGPVWDGLVDCAGASCGQQCN